MKYFFPKRRKTKMWFHEILRVLFSRIYMILKILLVFFTFQTPEHLANLNCLISSTFSQMSSKDFLCGYQHLQISPMREIPQILIFAERKISTIKISIFQVTALIKLVILHSEMFCKNGVLKNFAKLTGKYLESFFQIKLQT